MNYFRDRVTLKIRDKGNGFETRDLKEKTGLGIGSMREQLRSVGGTLVVDSAPSQGTKVRAEVPIVFVAPASTHPEVDKTTDERPNVSAV